MTEKQEIVEAGTTTEGLKRPAEREEWARHLDGPYQFTHSVSGIRVSMWLQGADEERLAGIRDTTDITPPEQAQ